MDKLSNTKLFETICEEHSIKFTNIETIERDENGWYSTKNIEFHYRNRSESSFYEIFLGLYEDEELRVASFFHELGHCTNTARGYSKYHLEKTCWDIGFAKAKEYGFIFSEKTLTWCAEQLETYKEEVV